MIGVNDVVSDFTTLSLIPFKNPFFLFWASLASLLCSVAASLVLSFYSTIKLSLSTRAFIFFLAQHKILGSIGQRNRIQEYCCVLKISRNL